jgi:hypothetical protein
MSAYQIRSETRHDGLRRWWIWWNPCHLDPDTGYEVEALEGSPFYSAREADEAMAADRHRRAGEPT